MSKRKIRYAVVGLGHIAQAAVLPAFRHARSNSELTALVSGSRTKLRELGEHYGVGARYRYEQFDELLASGEIDAVYIALPNHRHADFTIRAARAGIHVLCEKPLAVTEADCRAMIRAAERKRVKLMTAYRLHFEAANLGAIEILRSGKIGEPRIFNSAFTMNVKAGDIRLRSETGGGTLYDIGIYCINAARSLFRAEPVEVIAATANNGQKRFSEVEEMVAAILRFPDDRLASFVCSFGSAGVARYSVIGTKGDLQLDPAYEYEGELKQTLTIDEKSREKTFSSRDQFAPEILYFSDCVLSDREPEPSGWEGLADVRAIEALYESARTGRAVKVRPVEKTRHPSPKQEKRKRPVRNPKMVKVTAPFK